ncbi:hypothetical protein RFI_14720 [Reticulomyxa filosa]|uniref:Uncharacterized protein n=1 Tax=Reticulomyxa filosa TaxID=46433 RepID=X6N9R3_RETFI|nr:hypothetical protein RFI_14720 [Reticulomyxa filosa]|eukprot:ETO22479.1 hypothetical protein RFI_14720 [Reticulomyxa filosa]
MPEMYANLSLQEAQIGLSLTGDGDAKKLGHGSEDEQGSDDSDIEDDYSKVSQQNGNESPSAPEKQKEKEKEKEELIVNKLLGSTTTANATATATAPNTNTSDPLSPVDHGNESDHDNDLVSNKVGSDDESEHDGGDHLLSNEDNEEDDEDGTDSERMQLLESFLELNEPQINWKMIEYLSKDSFVCIRVHVCVCYVR